MDMIIIAGHVELPSHERDAFVAAHRDLITRARQAPGCLDAAITADPTNPGRIYDYERWESWAHVKAWRDVANAPETGIPMVADDVMAYEIAVFRPPFD